MIDLRIEFRLDKILEQSVKIEQVNNQYQDERFDNPNIFAVSLSDGVKLYSLAEIIASN